MLKGFAKPVPAWRVLREAPLASRFEAARATILAPFVGRAQEMGLLLERWRLAQHGEGQTVLLTGEPGMGKSRLVEALFDRIGSEPHQRIVVQCSPYHTNTAFYPVLRQIEQAARFVLEDKAAQKLDKLDAWLAKAGMPLSPIAPLLANLLSLPAEGRYPPLELAPAQFKNAAISALVDYILHLSERDPVLLDLEDAHWIDPTTLELMTRLIDLIGSARVLLVVTARPEFVSPWTGRDHVLTLALSRLSKTQCAEIVAGIAAAHSLTLEVVDDILARTDGVPLFVEELTRTMAESPYARSSRGAGDLAGLADGAARPARPGQGDRADRRRDRAAIRAGAARRRRTGRRRRTRGRADAIDGSEPGVSAKPRHGADIQLPARADPRRGLRQPATLAPAATP